MATRSCILCGAGACSCRGEASLAAEAVAITAIFRAATVAAALTMLNPTHSLYIADRRLCLNAAGEAVEADDPDRVSLLAAEGGALPYERALALGLIEAEDASRETDDASRETDDEPRDEIATAGPPGVPSAAIPASEGTQLGEASGAVPPTGGVVEPGVSLVRSTPRGTPQARRTNAVEGTPARTGD